MSVPIGPTGKAGGAPAGSASRSPLALALFVALCLGLSALLHAEPLIAAAAEMHLQPGVVAGVALAVAALFNLAILALNFLVARRPAAVGGPTTLLHPATTAGTAPVPTASASTTTPFAPFMVLCLSMSAALHAQPLVDAASASAAVYQIHPAVVVFVLLSVAALFNWAIISLNFRVARRPAAGEAKLLLHPAGTAGAAPTGSASISPIAPSIVLCLAMGAALHAEPLVDAVSASAAVYQIHPAVVVFVLLSVAALFNWAIISLNFRVARRPAAVEAKLLLHPAGTAGAAPTGSASISPIAPSIVLCLAMGAALHAEPLVAAAAEFHIHPAIVVCAVLAGAALFHLAVLSVHKSLARRQAGAGMLVSCMLPGSGAVSRAIAAHR